MRLKDIMTTFGGPYYGYFTGEDHNSVRNAIVSIHQQVDLFQIDGIIGFSQGATLGTIIASLMERDLLQQVLEGAHDDIRPDRAQGREPSASHTEPSDGGTTEMAKGSRPSLRQKAQERSEDSKSMPLRLKLLVGLCPISTSWYPESRLEQQLVHAMRRPGSNGREIGLPWLHKVSAVYTLGQADWHFAASEKFARDSVGEGGAGTLVSLTGQKQGGKGTSHGQVHTFPSGHEIPQTQIATDTLLSFIQAKLAVKR